MTNSEHFDRLTNLFKPLLVDLSIMWPKQDLTYVLEEVEHLEFGEALESLIAVGLQNKLKFNIAQIQQITELANMMEMGNYAQLLQLQQILSTGLNSD